MGWFPTLMRILQIGAHKIETPTIWLGHDLKHPFPVWKSVRACPGVMFSAFQVLERRWFREAAARVGVHRALQFDGPVFLDSGGFQLQRHPERQSSPATVIELSLALRPDICAILDYPLDPCGTDQANHRRWAKTVQSTRYTCSRVNHSSVAPVLHSFSVNTIAPRMAKLRSLCGRPAIWCFGSLVPLFHGSYIGSRFAENDDGLTPFRRRWSLIATLVREMRKATGKELLHVFGAGSLSTIFLLFLAGADSVDSASWRLKAAFGAIQLPGLADRFLIARKDHSRIRKVLTPKCREILSQCACPICNDLTLEKRITQLCHHFEARATHNAHVLISEITALRRAQCSGQLAEFVLNRLADTPLYRNLAEDVILPLVV
jgi:queuine/archaeosine tRNA-ribosyltransferase